MSSNVRPSLLGRIRQAFKHRPAPEPEGFTHLSEQLSNLLEEMRFRWRQEDELLQFLVRREHARIESERIRIDNSPAAVHSLAALRNSPNYMFAWEEASPLVTVRIASYKDTRSLIDRAIPSVLEQSYQNFEIVVVNDGPNPETREAIERLNEPRIRYSELDQRSRYPEHSHLRWMVAGGPGMNRGVELARGRWIAPLDDDDEFTRNHIEGLLALANATRAEFVYGALKQVESLTGKVNIIHSDPPQAGAISLQASLYHAGLRFFDYSPESWRVDEPGDWNLIRRMREAGVRFATSNEVVAIAHMVPVQSKTAS